MTAKQYLEQLQRAYQRYYYLNEILQSRRDLMLGNDTKTATDRKEIPRYVRELAAGTIDKIGSGLTNRVRKELEDELAERLAGRAPELGWAGRAHKEFLNRASDMARNIFTEHNDLAVGELSTASFNASAIPVPGNADAWVIAMNEGLSATVYEVSRTVAGTFKVNKGAESLSDTHGALLLHERLNYYLHLGVPYGTDSEISREQIFLASTVTTMAERFAYLHEISHIALDHHQNAPLRLLPGDWSSAEHAVHPFEQEFEADILAWQILSRLFVRSMADLQMAYAGASMLLKVADLLERADDLAAVGTHPPASLRIGYLHEQVKTTANDARVSFDDAATMARAMSDKLDSLMRLAPPLPGESPFELLLEKTSSAVIPDYMTFQAEMMDLLSRAAPAKLCRVLGFALGKAEEDLRNLGVISDEPETDRHMKFSKETLDAARKPFNKLKLVGGLMGLYLIPEITRFIERYRREYLERKND